MKWEKKICWGGWSTIKSDTYWTSNLSPLHLSASTQICRSFFFSNYWGQSLPIQALNDIMPEPIKREGGKEWMLSSSPVSRLFLVQFRLSLRQMMHGAIFILFLRGLAWWLLHYPLIFWSLIMQGSGVLLVCVLLWSETWTTVSSSE